MSADLLGHVFESAFLRSLFSRGATIERYLTVEVALARVQGRLGIVPPEVAPALEAYDPGAIGRARFDARVAAVGFPLVPLLEELTSSLPGGLGEFVHWGATTQDIMDTGLVLQLRDALRWFEDGVRELQRRLAALADAHRATSMVGRSQLQHAEPITFGYKVATWLDPLHRHLERLDELRPRALRVQLGGAAGTLAALDPAGLEVREALAVELELASPDITWHVSRDGLAEVLTWLGLLVGSLSKIATDVLLMAQTEVGELSDGSRGTSSAMPHKQNPVLAQRVVVAASAVRPVVTAMLEAMAQDHERGTALWQREWLAVPRAVIHAGGCLENAMNLVAGLDVHADRMRENADRMGGLVRASAVVMALAPALGRHAAHDIVAEAARSARSGRGDFVTLLSRREAVALHLSPDQLRALTRSYEANTPTVAHMVDATLDRVARGSGKPREG